MNLKLAILPAFAALAACAPAPVVTPVAPVQPVPMVRPVEGVAGLEERQPDLCKAKDYLPVLGQPRSALSQIAIPRNYRIVEYRGIEPQEYDPSRVVFRLDASGNIYNIDCG